MDSNLADVPMVYTVADGKAVSIMHLTLTAAGETESALTEPLNFGVTCSGTESVEVRFEGVDALEGNTLYVIDAVEGSSMPIEENAVVSILPNEYGRYYISSSRLVEKENDISQRIRVSVHGGVVTVSAIRSLGRVRALSTNGTTAYSAEDCGDEVSFSLHRGIYVIETTGEAGTSKVKIAVR
jgi:hypothetical protein